MQPVNRRRHRLAAHVRRIGRDYTCWTGVSSAYDPLCPPMRPDLGAPELQHCGYRNAERRRCWTAIVANFSLGSGYGVGEQTRGTPRRQRLAGIAPGMGHFTRRQAMTGFSAGYAHDGGGGGPYGYPSHPCGEFYGTQNPVRRGERARMLAAGADARHGCGYGDGDGASVGYAHDGGGGGPYGYLWLNPAGELEPGERYPTEMGYSAGAMQRVATAMPRVAMPYPNADGLFEAPSGSTDGDAFVAAFPDGTLAMMICCGGVCCTYGYGDCKGFLVKCLFKRLSGKGNKQETPGGTGWIRTAPAPNVAVTPASGKSARSVRRYNLMAASRQSAGMSVGLQSPGVRPQVNDMPPDSPRPFGYPWIAGSEGIFYGVQNPVRAAMRDRQFPTGFQQPDVFPPQGFAVGGCGGGCNGGCG